MGETDLSHLSDAERRAFNVVGDWLMEEALEGLLENWLLNRD